MTINCEILVNGQVVNVLQFGAIAGPRALASGTFGQHDDLISHPDRREAMGNQNGHLLLSHFMKVVKDVGFRFGIHRRGGSSGTTFDVERVFDRIYMMDRMLREDIISIMFILSKQNLEQDSHN